MHNGISFDETACKYGHIVKYHSRKIARGNYQLHHRGRGMDPSRIEYDRGTGKAPPLRAMVALARAAPSVCATQDRMA
jgi:hypothetical protein